jgi:hypothetical protein
MEIMVLNDLLKVPGLEERLNMYLQVEKNHNRDIAVRVKNDFMVMFRLDEVNFRELVERYRQKYIETDKYDNPKFKTLTSQTKRNPVYRAGP